MYRSINQKQNKMENQIQTNEIKVSDEAQRVIDLLTNAANKSPNGVTFVSIKNYENEQGEIANHLFNIGRSYEKAIQKDIETLRNLDLTTLNSKHPLTLLEEARTELINAFLKPNENRSNGQKNAYLSILNGLKVHVETGFLYVWGFREQKTIIKAGTYKMVNSKPLTLAKDELRKLLQTNKFKNFKIKVGETIKGGGETLEL